MAQEETSLLSRYHRRAPVGADRRYLASEPARLLELGQRDRILMRELSRTGVTDLADLRILDVGCGSGFELNRFVVNGAKAKNMYGIDLLAERVEVARQVNRQMHVVQGNAASLPWPMASFDLVTQFTTFSSILSDVVRRDVAAEMWRVLRPGGKIIWYDFWFNPVNGDVRGVRPKEIRTLFPKSVGRITPLTLAPPVARPLARWNWRAASVLQELRLLQSHYLGVLERRK